MPTDRSVLFKDWRLLGLLLLACTVAVIGGIWVFWNSPSTSDSKPDTIKKAEVTLTRNMNIVIFLIDALRADRLGVYGYSKPTSPNIDALAAEGVVFEQCNAPAPWTLPSVVSMFTSMFPCEHGVVVDGQKINPSIETLAVRLKKAGYATCGFSASAYAGPMSGLDRGYDIYNKVRAVNGTTIERWLGNAPETPFYLYIHNIEPHCPFEVPLWLVQLFGNEAWGFRQRVHKLSYDYRSLTRVDFKAKQPLGTTDNTAQQQAVMRELDKLKYQISVLYDAAVRHADENLGSVIEFLKRRSLWDKTLFILIADHGEELGEHGGWQHDQSVYEELIHVPLIVHFPGGQYAGRRVKDVVSLVDLMPTIFDYLQRLELATDLRGNSLMPFVRGVSSRDPEELVITAMRINKKKYYRPYKEMRGDINIVIRQNHWKGIFNVELNSVELYNLAEDAGEKVNLSTQYAGCTDAMHKYAQKWLSARLADAVEAMPRGPETLDDETIQRLRSLGYLE